VSSRESRVTGRAGHGSKSVAHRHLCAAYVNIVQYVLNFVVYLFVYIRLLYVDTYFILNYTGQ